MNRFFPLLLMIIALGFVPAVVLAQHSGQHGADTQEYAQPENGKADHDNGAARSDSDKKSGPSDKKMRRHGDMAAKREKLHQDMKEMEQRLDAKVAAMNSATGDAKVTAMSDVINELVAQRKELMGRFKSFHGKMHKKGKNMGSCCGIEHGGGKGGMHGGSAMMGRDMSFKNAAFEVPAQP
jgi:hypothetical protein